MEKKLVTITGYCPLLGRLYSMDVVGTSEAIKKLQCIHTIASTLFASRGLGDETLRAMRVPSDDLVYQLA